VKPGESGGGITFRADYPWGKRLGHVFVPAAADLPANWMDLEAELFGLEGVHALWLVFDGEGEKLFSLDEFEFY